MTKNTKNIAARGLGIVVFALWSLTLVGCIPPAPSLVGAFCQSDQECRGLSCVGGVCRSSALEVQQNDASEPFGRDEDLQEATPEGICNPGLTRTCYGAAASTANQGVCSVGFQVCGPEGTWEVRCLGEVLPGKERCGNGLDDDCDGQTDEDCRCETGTSQACGKGVGVCALGMQSCLASGIWGACEGEGKPSAEECDGLDNNCDGQIDESNPGGGTICDTGKKGECQRGLTLCAPGQGKIQCVQQNSQSPEACDGLDNNCDGQIDETLQRTCFSLGAGCREGSQGSFVCKGECATGTQSCAQGKWSPCEGQKGPTTEACDGLDNDCDGSVDEDGCSCDDGKTQPCGKDTGECRKGTQRCVGGVWGPCENEVLPVAEVCDGKDNNCNGSIDEKLVRDCSNLCGTGEESCVNGKWGSCSAPPVKSEVCNGKDDNCDGQVDEGFAGLGQTCEQGVGACRQEGKIACTPDGTGTTCSASASAPPAAEVCDGKDNDCDGATDEDFVTLGKPCTVGRGECLRTGSLICKSSADGVRCSAQPGAPAAEACDGKDNDCDGQLDEGCKCTDQATRPCGSDQGECKAGTQTCQGGIWQPCVGKIAPVAEVCDGKDNDCDGAIDDGNPEGGASCSVPNAVGLCQDGKEKCQGGALKCVSIREPQPEACNGKDDDCDGSTDETFSGKGTYCATNQPGICAAGTLQCQSGRKICKRDQSPTTEKCNRKDDDCDGATDEGNPGGGGVCIYSGKDKRGNPITVCQLSRDACVNGSVQCQPSGNYALCLTSIECALCAQDGISYSCKTAFANDPKKYCVKR